MTGIDAGYLMVLRFVAYQGRVDINECTRSERLTVWALADRGLLTSVGGFYTVTDAGRVELAAAGANPPARTPG